jgi:hypothetical protein
LLTPIRALPETNLGLRILAARLQRAWSATIGIHVFQCVFAACFALPFVSSVSVPGVLVRARVAQWVEWFRLGDALDGSVMRAAVLPFAAALLNYPWLSVAWLRALELEEPFSDHARYALGRYRAAFSTAVATLCALGLIVVVGFGSSRAIAAALVDRWDDRSTDLMRLAVFLLCAWAALVVVTVQDAAYAAISGEHRGFRAIAAAAFSPVRWRWVAVRLALVLAQTVLGLTAWGIPRIALGPGPAADLVMLVVTQCAAFVITCGRAVWLAWVLDQVLKYRLGSGSPRLRAV